MVNHPQHYNRDGAMECIDEMIAVFGKDIGAVDKETPKKPIDVEFGPCGDLMLCCPTCKNGVVPIPTYHGNMYYPRCPFCGQLLKGDNEDE